MRRTVVAIGCATVALLVPPSATSGGWWTWIQLDRETVAAGHEMQAYADVMFSSGDAAEAAQSGRNGDAFYVYLLRGFDYSIVQRAMRQPSPRNWWSVGGADAYRVGRVVIGERHFNLARATASFRVPEQVTSGKYVVMFCDAGCAHPLGNVIPSHTTPLTVTAARTPGTPAWAYAGWLAAGVVVGALVGFLGGRRRATRLLPVRTTPWQPTDEELEELLASGRDHRDAGARFRRARGRDRRTAPIA
jgi:hypothetical protein